MDKSRPVLFMPVESRILRTQAPQHIYNENTHFEESCVRLRDGEGIDPNLTTYHQWGEGVEISPKSHRVIDKGGKK